MPATVTRRLLPVLLLASSTLLRAAPNLPEITAARTEVTDAGTVFTGNARLDYDGAVLIADQIAYDPKAQVARATGRVTLTRGPQRLLADELTYNLTERTYTVTDLRIGQDPLYISGSSLEGTPEKIIIHDAIITFSEPGLAAPSLRASNVTYVPGKTVRAENARVGIGPIMPIPIPLYDQSVKDPFLSYFSVKAGYSSNLGGELDIGLLAPVNRWLRLGGDLGIYTKRGVLFGPAFSYQANNGEDTVHGRFKSGYIQDGGTRGLDITATPIPEERGYVSWEHYQTIGGDITLLGQLNYWSDSDIIRDFRERDFREVQTPDNYAEGYYTGENHVISVFTRFQPNEYHVVQRRLPEIRFDGLPVDVGAGVYHRLNASFASVEDKSLPALADPVNRVDAYYGLTRPFTPREWFSFKPVAGARFTHYDRALAGESDYTRVLGEIGFDADLTASSTYDYQNTQWKIDGLRHVVKPYVSYRAVGNADQGAAYIPPIDRTAFSTYLQPLGLGDRRDIDTLPTFNTVRLGVDNKLQTRDPAYGSRDLAELNVAGDWRTDGNGAGPRFSAIQTELAVNPARWLRFDVYSNVTPGDMTLREINTGVTFRDPGVWSARVGTDFLKGSAATPGIQEYSLELRYFLNEAYEALAHFRYDSNRGDFSQQTFGLRQNIRNLWFIDYLVSIREGDTRAGDLTFSISIELASF